MLNNLSLYNFKNHKEIELEFDFFNLIVGQNGSGKTNILESIYLLLNSHVYGGLKINRLVNFFGENLFVDGVLDNSDGMTKEFKVTFDSASSKTSYIYNKTKVTKPRYIDSLKHTAVFFSPAEINIMYLGPSMRRDFLDEVCMLFDPSFLKIKSDYSKILRNRNKLLKNISEGKASKGDLKFRNDAFISKATSYYIHRKKFLDFIKERISKIEDILGNKYSLEFEYITKVDFTDIEGSIKSYIEKNIDRDIIVGHTYIGPHLDDFEFRVQFGKTYYNSSEFLSRGENKSILIGLKFLEIDFYLQKHSENIVILLDDIFSELDNEHIKAVLDFSKRFQTFISAQNSPSFLLNSADIKIINI
ncbi:MAG: DNA replication and repair protein RecF [Candidatus Gracilibacteria bacterium]|nr:DNA replication and repair protein RecF [Candidatus Gracilibacteria bacterium]MDD2908751.1 DNA replication and repair protein RecF [Candidatus Gracilibacteria bacterium]